MVTPGAQDPTDQPAEKVANGQGGQRKEGESENAPNEAADDEVEGDTGEGFQDGEAGSGYPGGDEEWEEIFADPLTIRFTQDKIHPFFYRRGPIVNVVPKIRAVQGAEADDVLDLVPPFTAIHCLRKGEELWSMDNRRLYALQLAAMDQWPSKCRVRILSRERLSRHKFKTQYRKFSTTCEGQHIEVCTRFQQFDTWSWYERAIELEMYSLSQRLGLMLSIFEAAPVLGALLFRSGLTGFESRTPLFVAFAMAISFDFLRQKVAIIERALCEIQVDAIMDGEIVTQSSSWFKGSDSEEDETVSSSSRVQLAAQMVIALVLLLPYILGVAREKVRSSLFSCWLGVAFMLVVQLASAAWAAWTKRRNKTKVEALRKHPKGWKTRRKEEGAADGNEGDTTEADVTEGDATEADGPGEDEGDEPDSPHQKDGLRKR
eukprot:TRINITY_DN9609_c1_g1_i1.p1 TRINITY_DN9609_c1_g1~~TRINITY_DN9609_c1_g1_i1.p1  ORF type:complete len:432 (-),score=93.54 TRINITY_DN9609_c1_g1_i1:207-1502(-)